MMPSYQHLQLSREQPITEKRTRPYPPASPPDDPVAHVRELEIQLRKTIKLTQKDIGGFDNRRLFRFSVEKGFNPDDLKKITTDIEFISQENEDVVVAFVSQSALQAFEARLASMAKGEHVTNQQVYYALQSINGWSVDDRTGWALKQDGFPNTETFKLDVELWPIEDNLKERNQLWRNFESWLQKNEITSLDSAKQEGLTIYRVRCDKSQAERLLHHRDVRIVDLPPRFGLSIREHLGLDIQQIPPISSPPLDAPKVAILDSGIVTGHPLLSSAIGDAQSFLSGYTETDVSGHGTHVAGISLYGDISKCVDNKIFFPELFILSGRILNEHNESDELIHNSIRIAVEYFHREYDCKIFNLSFGDSRKPYLGGHLRGLAYTLDELSRKYSVLFVVSAGNVSDSRLEGLDWQQSYPAYLTHDEWSILDPATALNVLTVGSLARLEASFNAQRYRDDPAELPIAKSEQPSPFTRHGPTIGGAIKPELVAFGGNWGLNARNGVNRIVDSGLGELSTNIDFSKGPLMGIKCGTSFAAPHVTHLAGKILSEYPNASSNLLRALLVAHATIPNAVEDIFDNANSVRKVLGYGHIDTRTLLKSAENELTLLSESSIENKQHHFYELLIPDDFLTTGKRNREIVVSLSYTPPVRSTRIHYKATRLDFRLIAADDLNQAVKMFNKETSKDDYQNIKELMLRSDKKWIEITIQILKQENETS